MAEAGIRDLRDHLSQYIDRVRAGEEVTVTDRGTAVARILPVTEPRPFDRLVSDGIIERAPRGGRRRPTQRTQAEGTISDLVPAQRR